MAKSKNNKNEVEETPTALLPTENIVENNEKTTKKVAKKTNEAKAAKPTRATKTSKTKEDLETNKNTENLTKVEEETVVKPTRATKKTTKSVSKKDSVSEKDVTPDADSESKVFSPKGLKPENEGTEVKIVEVKSEVKPEIKAEGKEDVTLVTNDDDFKGIKTETIESKLQKQNNLKPQNNPNRYNNKNSNTNFNDKTNPQRKISNESPNYQMKSDRFTVKPNTNIGGANQSVLTKYDNRRPKNTNQYQQNHNRFGKPIQSNKYPDPIKDFNAPINSYDTNDLKKLQEIEFKNKMRNEEAGNHQRNKPNHNNNHNHHNHNNPNKKQDGDDKRNGKFIGKNQEVNNTTKQEEKKEIVQEQALFDNVNLTETLQEVSNLKPEKQEVKQPHAEVKVEPENGGVDETTYNKDNKEVQPVDEVTNPENQTYYDYPVLEVTLNTNEENQVVIDLNDELENIQKAIREVKKSTLNEKNKNRKEKGLPPILPHKLVPAPENVVNPELPVQTEQTEQSEEELGQTIQEITRPIEQENEEIIEVKSGSEGEGEGESESQVAQINQEVEKTLVVKPANQEVERQNVDEKNESKQRVNDKHSHKTNDKQQERRDKNTDNTQNLAKEQVKREQQKEINKNLEKAIPKKEFIPKPKPFTNLEKRLSDVELKDPFFKKIIDSTYRFLRYRLYVEEGTTILVGVSGGVDSVVMFDILFNVAARYNIGLEVAHYNHNLRGQASVDDERFVRSLAEFYGVQYHFKNGYVKEYSEKNSLSIETAARNLRYDFFVKVANTIKCSFVATAHNANDLAETFILNLTRGSGLTGLSGIPVKRPLTKFCNIIRPIIDIKKSEILEYAKLRGLEWKEDYTNSEAVFTRNKIRHVVLPLLEQEFNPAIVDVINRTAKLIGGADRFLSRFINENTQKVVSVVDDKTIKINIPVLKTYNFFIQGEIFQNILSYYFAITQVSLNLVDRLIDLTRAEQSAKIQINKELRAVKDREEIIITKKQEAQAIDFMLNRTVAAEYDLGEYIFKVRPVSVEEVDYDSENHIEYFDAEFMPQFLNLRFWKDGDSFRPLGMNGNSMKISDFLTNEKVPLDQKRSVLVLTDKVNIIWVVGYRLSEDYKVKSNSSQILKVEITKK